MYKSSAYCHSSTFDSELKMDHGILGVLHEHLIAKLAVRSSRQSCASVFDHIPSVCILWQVAPQPTVDTSIYITGVGLCFSITLLFPTYLLPCFATEVCRVSIVLVASQQLFANSSASSCKTVEMVVWTVRHGWVSLRTSIALVLRDGLVYAAWLLPDISFLFVPWDFIYIFFESSVKPKKWISCFGYMSNFGSLKMNPRFSSRKTSPSVCVLAISLDSAITKMSEYHSQV